MLQVSGLVRTYRNGRRPPVPVLRGVDFTLAEGELLVIAGRSGSGKTTLLHLLVGVDRPDGGEVRFETIRLHPIAGEGEMLRWRRTMGFLHQTPVLVPTLTSWENAVLPFRYWGKPNADWVSALFDRLGIAELKHRRPRELSGGQATRVALARALARRPPVVFADEPTGRLDAETAGAVWELLVDLNQTERMAALVVTHDPVILRRAARVAWLVDGRLRDRGDG